MQDPLSQLLPQIVGGLPKIMSAAPWWVIIVFVVGLGMAALKPSRRRRRRQQWRPTRPVRRPLFSRRPRSPAIVPPREPDAADQLRTVMASGFTAKPLLNRSETFVLKALEPLVAELLPEWRVMAQVSLGEILKGENNAAQMTVNAKRVDFLLVDSLFQPRLVVEYQGSGHHQGNAAARDAVKKEALRRAGIVYGEVLAGDTVADLRALVMKVCLRPPTASAA
jgi:very-short-patch-repair endonuclease